MLVVVVEPADFVGNPRRLVPFVFRVVPSDEFSTGGLDLLDEIVADDFIDHDPMPDQPPGLIGLKHAIGSLRAPVPDGAIVVNKIVGEGDEVVARV